MKKVFYILIAVLLYSCVNTEGVVDNERTYYTEKHRPQIHFTPAEKWMNDPNGMVYYEGEYHLFYQYYPDSTVWGPMHWGHAVSTDLVVWEHLPIGLYPDSLGYIFSGSAVVDKDNTSGLGKDGKPPLIAIFTHHDPVGEKAGAIDFQYQSIAYSNDKGRTWTMYEGNPVVANPGIRDFRDPKVIWDTDSRQWVMVFAAWDQVKFYGSSDLINWTHLSDWGQGIGCHEGVWACPDLFPMKVETTGEKKWVLLQSLNPGAPNGGSGTQYFIGDFDGKEFLLDTEFAKALGQTPEIVPEGVVFEDFETTYSKWKVEGTAFGTEPTKGVLPNQQEVSGVVSKGAAISYIGGDSAVGRLLSKEFEIEQDFINFKIGGGNDKLRTNICLVINGEKVRTSAGANSEKLVWKGWDVQEFRGQKARIEINDTHKGGWGHINVDEIVFSDGLAQAAHDKGVWLDYGRDNYAGVTWSDIPEKDGRRIFIGWMSNWDYAQVVPTEKWRSATTLPRELQLIETTKGLRLRSYPVEELSALNKKSQPIASQVIREKEPLILPEEFIVSVCKTDFTFVDVEENSIFGIRFFNTKGEEFKIGFDASRNSYFTDRTKSGNLNFSQSFAQQRIYAPAQTETSSIQFVSWWDVASSELFAENGQTVMTDIFFPSEDFTEAEIFVEKGKVTLQKGEITPLKGIW